MSSNPWESKLLLYKCSHAMMCRYCCGHASLPSKVDLSVENVLDPTQSTLDIFALQFFLLGLLHRLPDLSQKQSCQLRLEQCLLKSVPSKSNHWSLEYLLTLISAFQRGTLEEKKET